MYRFEDKSNEKKKKKLLSYRRYPWPGIKYKTDVKKGEKKKNEEKHSFHLKRLNIVRSNATPVL